MLLMMKTSFGVRRRISPLGQLRTPATYPCYVRSWVTSGRGEEVVGTSVPSQEETAACLILPGQAAA
jgi:hypothetical protein